MKSSTILISTTVLLTPLVVHAAEKSMFTRTLDAWSTQHAINTRIEEVQAEQDTFFASETLLPPLPKDIASTAASSSVSEWLTVTIGGAPVIFRDVPMNAWFAPYVRSAIADGYMRGYTTPQGTARGLFGPSDPVTLEQLTKVLVSATGQDTTLCPRKALNEKVQNTWSEPYVSCAEVGEWPIVSDVTMDPTRPATRLEVVALVLHAFHVQPEPTEVSPFTDVPSSMQFSGYMSAAKRDGLIYGTVDPTSGEPTGFFKPLENVTRAEFSKIIVAAGEIYRK